MIILALFSQSLQAAHFCPNLTQVRESITKPEPYVHYYIYRQ